MRFRDKNWPALYPILKTAGFAGFFSRRAQTYGSIARIQEKASNSDEP
jgi:hypothetical protein